MLRNKLSVAVALATASVTLLSGGVIAANADEATPDNAIAQGLKNLTFTIHKYAGDVDAITKKDVAHGLGVENQGAVVTSVEGVTDTTALDNLDKVEGVVFCAIPMEETGMLATGALPKKASQNVDSLREQGFTWINQQAPKLTADCHYGNSGEKTGIKLVTNSNGEATITNKGKDASVLTQLPLQPQQYLVVEQTPAGDAIKVNGEVKKGLSPSQPFLITLPMPGKAGVWNWDVNVYPKNTINNVTKTVKDETASYGNKISYDIKAPIPAPDVHVNATTKTLSSFTFLDELDGRFQFGDMNAQSVNQDADLKANVTVKVVKSTQPEDVTLTPNVDTDYTLALNNGTGSAEGKHILVVDFTEDGLKNLALHRGDTVVVTVTPTYAGEKTANMGDLNNKAAILPPGHKPSTPITEVPTDVPTSEVTSKFGGVTIVKEDSKETSTKLKGAKFEVYVCAAGKTDEYDSAKKIAPVFKTSEKPDNYDNKGTWTSDDNGKVVITGLHYTNWVDGKQVNDNSYNYCLREVEAPAGYALPSDPSNTHFAVAHFTVTQPNADLSLEVKNTKTTGDFNLPLTGSSALVISGLLGAGIAASGVLFLVMRKRKENAEA